MVKKKILNSKKPNKNTTIRDKPTKVITISPKNVKNIPTIPVTKIISSTSFQDRLNDIVDNIDIDTDDLSDDLIDIYDELELELAPKFLSKNLMLWAAIFSPVVLPGIVKGMRSEPTVAQPKVIIKGRQQEVIPPVEPRKIVDYCAEYFKTRGLELCKSLTETDLARLKDDLKQNWNKGPEAFAEAFKESYPVSKSRLETIYRNERHQSEYFGVLERAKNSDHQYKRWETIGDERTCSECLAMDGEFVPINEKFSNGQMIPSAHVQCRCSMTTYSEEDYEDLPDEFIRQDSAYLQDVSEFIKLNYKCPENSHGDGFGCGGEGKSENLASKISVIEPSESQLVLKGTRKPSNAESQTVSKVINSIPPELLKWSGDLDIRKTGLEVVVTSPEYEASPNHGWTSHAMVNRVFLQQDVFEGKDPKHPYGEGTIKHELIHALVGSKIDSHIPGGGKSVLTKENIRMPIHAYDSNHNGGSIDEFYTMVMDRYEGNGKFNDNELAKIEVEKELGKGKWGDYLHSSKWTPEELSKVKDIALKWTNDKSMLDTFLNKERKLQKWEEEDALLQQQDASYLNDVASFMKQNKKCKVGTFDDTNACGPEKEANTEDKLTLSEKQVVDYYQRTGYGNINAFLRNSETKAVLPQERAIVEGQIKQLESAINKSKLTEELKVFKGIGSQYSIYKNIDNLVGTIVSDPGFGSTSTSVDIAAQHARVGRLTFANQDIELPEMGIIAVMKLPSGTPALDIKSIPELANRDVEKEILVQHGMPFRITSIDKDGAYWRIDMEAVPLVYSKLTPEEKSVIKSYSGNGYIGLNSSLRRNDLDEETSKNVKLLDSAIAKSKLSSRTLFRGFSNKDVYNNNVTEVNDLGYISTGKTDFTARVYAGVEDFPIIEKIHIPEGFNGLEIDKNEFGVRESEVLLPRDTKFKVLKSWKEGRFKWIEVEPVSDQKLNSLLEDVADFMKLNYNCPKEEKQGEGKGSCSNGNLSNESDDLSIRPMKDGRFFVALRTYKELGPASMKDKDGKNVYSGWFKTQSEAEQFKEKLSKMIPNDHTSDTSESRPKKEEPIKEPIKEALPNKISDIKEIKGQYFTTIKNKNLTIKYKNTESKKSKSIANNIIQSIDRLPDVLRSKITSITILSGGHKTDDSNSVVTGQVDRKERPGHISLYNTKSSDQAMSTIIHESAHLLDQDGGISSSPEYAKTVTKDGFISSYAKDVNKSQGKYFALKEDFADSIKMYVDSPEKLKQISPSRYNILDKHIGNKIKSNQSYLNEVANQLKLNYKCRKEDSPDTDTETLSEVTEFLKLNKKCKSGTFDESNKCGPEKENNNANNIDITTFKDIGLSIKLPNIKTVNSISGKLFGSEDSIEAVAAYEKSTNTILVRDIDWEKYTKLADKKEPGPISHTKENTILHELSHIVAPTDTMKVKYINPDQQKAWQNFFIENGGSVGVSKLIGKYGAENLSETIPEALTIYLGNKEKTDDKIVKFLKEANIIKDSNNSFQEVSSSFNPELGGFHTTDYKTTRDKPLRVIS